MPLVCMMVTCRATGVHDGAQILWIRTCDRGGAGFSMVAMRHFLHVLQVAKNNTQVRTSSIKIKNVTYNEKKV